METENESQSLPPVTKSGSTVEIVSRQDDDSFIEVDSQPKTELSTVQSDATEPPPSAANGKFIVLCIEELIERLQKGLRLTIHRQ